MKKKSVTLTFLVGHQSPKKNNSSPCMFVVWIMMAAMILSIIGITIAPAWAKSGDLDPTFDPGAGVSQVPFNTSQAFYSGTNNPFNGYSLVNGTFTMAGGSSHQGVVRLKADGTVDPNFNAEVKGHVFNCILLDPTSSISKMLIVGPFSTTNTSGLTYSGLARLNDNGTVDTSFGSPDSVNPGYTFDNTSGCSGAQAFGVQSDGKIIVAGNSMRLHNDPNNVYYLVRFNADGTVDTSYPKRSAPGAYARGVTVYSSSDLYYPNYTCVLAEAPDKSVPGRSMTYMLFLDGDGNVVSSLGDEALNGPIIYWANQTFNNNAQRPKPVIVGQFTQVFGVAMNRVARLNAMVDPVQGLVFSRDPSFTVAGSGPNNFVQRATIEKVSNLETGNIVLAGNFNSFSGTPCGYIVRLKPDSVNGSMQLDDTFNPGGSGADSRIWTIFQYGAGSSSPSYGVLGRFKKFNGEDRAGIARLDKNGNLLSLYAGLTIDDTSWWVVNAIEVLNDGKIIIGGDFTNYGGQSLANLAKVNYDGSVDQLFIGGVTQGGLVKAMRAQPDGKILVGGDFCTAVGYNVRTSLVRFNPDGSVDMTFNPVITQWNGSWPIINSIDVQEDGKIFIAGSFQRINGHYSHCVARLNADGTTDTDFSNQTLINGGYNYFINAGRLVNGLYPIAGGITYNGSQCGFYTRLTQEGVLDTTFGPAGPVAHVNLFNAPVICVAGAQDSRLIVGGYFTQMIDASNTPVGHFAGFTSNGLLDGALQANPGANNPVNAIQDMGQFTEFLFGGGFSSLNNISRKCVARVKSNGMVDSSFNPGTGTNAPVWCLQILDKSRSYIGGSFSTYNGVTRRGIARIITQSGTITPTLFLLLDYQ